MVSAQDGLRPLDWALQQGHHKCARILRELDTPTRTQEEAQESRGQQSRVRVSSIMPITPSSVINHVVIMSVTSLSIIYQVYIIVSIYIHLSFDLSSYAFMYLFIYT